MQKIEKIHQKWAKRVKSDQKCVKNDQKTPKNENYQNSKYGVIKLS